MKTDTQSMKAYLVRQRLQVRFKSHAIKRYKERIGEVQDAIPSSWYFYSKELEKQVRSGTFFLDEEWPSQEKGYSTGFYIIYNNSVVFKGEKRRIHGKKSRDGLLIGTVYPYKKNLREVLAERKRVSLDDYF